MPEIMCKRMENSSEKSFSFARNHEVRFVILLNLYKYDDGSIFKRQLALKPSILQLIFFPTFVLLGAFRLIAFFRLARSSKTSKLTSLRNLAFFIGTDATSTSDSLPVAAPESGNE